ncbi:MAG: hypothetical protein HY326_12170 [Chloroflexi bacterium]|nr:hypothetical protein [Chloroflexota bacterium]
MMDILTVCEEYCLAHLPARMVPPTLAGAGYAEQIAQQSQADVEICTLTAYLSAVYDSVGGPMALTALLEILQAWNYPSERAEWIVRTVEQVQDRAIMTSGAATLEARVVHDALNLDRIGGLEIFEGLKREDTTDYMTLAAVLQASLADIRRLYEGLHTIEARALVFPAYRNVQNFVAGVLSLPTMHHAQALKS